MGLRKRFSLLFERPRPESGRPTGLGDIDEEHNHPEYGIPDQFSLRSSQPRPAPGPTRRHEGPTIQPDDPSTEAVSDQIMRDTQRCISLLRSMYEADYAVFSSRHIAPREQKAYRNKHMELANTRLRQIRGILGAWDKIPRSQLGSQERKLMQEITLMMNAKEVGRTRFAKS